MQTANVPVEDIQVTVLLTIMINAAHAVAEDTLIILGAKPREVDTPVREERFIISASLAQLQRLVLIQQQHPITGMPDVQQDTLQHGHRIAVQVVRINGMDITIFFVPFVEISVTQAQNGALCIAVQV